MIERMRLVWLVVVLAACKPTGPCGDAIDESFARKHAARQKEAREHPERRQQLLDDQYADDQEADTRRALLVKHCANEGWSAEERTCVARGEVEPCLSSSERAELDDDHGRMDPDEALTQFSVFTDRMCRCRDKACADRVNDGMTKWAQAMARNAGNAKPDEDMMKKGADIAKRFADCMSRAMTIETPPPPPPPPPLASDLPPNCVRYMRMIEGLARCERMPQASRDALKQGIDAMRSAWNFKDMPADARKTALDAADSACKQGADAIQQGAAAAGCPDPLMN